tara:strand:+ start:562 stop:705 length:144 start_codon:yes stop_codon:yes gene_type:complete
MTMPPQKKTKEWGADQSNDETCRQLGGDHHCSSNDIGTQNKQGTYQR